MVHERRDGNVEDKDRARTPPSLFRKLDARWRFEFDLSCETSNCLCRNGIFFDKGQDMLTTTFRHLSTKPITGFCNPIYSNPAPFIAKCAEESLNGHTIVMLLPADTSCIAFHRYVMGYDYSKDGSRHPNEFGASEIIFIKSRIKFNNPDGTPMSGAPKFGSMVVVFRKEDFDGSPVISSMNWRE